MAAAESMERAHGLACAGGNIYAARQSGLWQACANGEERNLYASSPNDINTPTFAIGLADAGETLLAGILGGVAHSTDGGQTWALRQFRRPAPLVTALALSPAFAVDGVALAGTLEDGLFRSADGGLSWSASSHGLFDHGVYALALSPAFAQDGVAFAGTGSGIYRSENGGRLWRDLPMPAGDETALCLELSPDFAEDATVYAGCERHGLLRSRDAGQTWERLLETEGAVNGIALLDGCLALQLDDAVLRWKDGDGWRELIEKGADCLTHDEAGALRVAMADGRIERIMPD